MTKDKSIFIKNVYYMLSYAFTTLQQSYYEDLATERFENIHNLFAAILAKGIGLQLKQGLYREYVNQHEELTVMRGKIDLPSTIRNRVAHKQTLTCEYDELSENNLFNQIIKSTVIVLLKNAKLDEAYKGELKKEMLFFSNVDMVDLQQVRWNMIRFHRNNQTYRMLLSICQLFSQGLLMTTEAGETKLASFIDDQRMCRLYEKFILEFYKAEYPKLKTEAPQISWALDDDVKTYLPIMQSDVVISYGKKKLIIDAKYYTHTMQSQYDHYSLHSNNLYQIFTYVKNMEANQDNKAEEVSGMLLYAKTDEKFQPEATYHMSGNKIGVRVLDLSKDFSEITAQLHLIARDHFGDFIC